MSKNISGSEMNTNIIGGIKDINFRFDPRGPWYCYRGRYGTYNYKKVI